MSKTVKLEDKTYQALEKFRGKRETFSGAVDRLITIKDGVGVMVDVLEGNQKFVDLVEAKSAKTTAVVA